MSESITTAELLEGKSVRNLVLRLGIPAMFGQLFNMLYNIVDRIFVGQIPQTGGTALASIGICAPALTAVSAFAYMVGIGGASGMSICLGQKNQRQAKEIMGNSFFLLLGISSIVMIVLFLVREPFLYILGCSDTMYPYAKTYFSIYICGTMASLCGIGLNHFLLAQGFAKQGMVAVMIGAVINVFLDPLLIFGCDMGIAGAAIATVISQCCMAAFVVLQLCKRKMPIRLAFYKPKWILCRKILSIGSMAFLITILDNLIIVLLNMILRKCGGTDQGDQLITCATVIQSFMAIVSCPAQGITSGCGTIYSYHYGAGHYDKICQAFRGVFLLCGVYIGLLEVSVQIFPALFTGLFLSDNSLNEMASRSIQMYTMALPGIAVQYALVDGLTAMGKIQFAFPLSVFRKMVYIFSVFILPEILDIRFIFLSGTISDAVGSIFSIVLFFSVVLPSLKKELQYRNLKQIKV